jgi:hypothetical protein
VFPQQELLESLGPPITNEVVARLRGFAHVPRAIVERLRADALAEVWGQNLFVLEKYLAVNLAWSIEQEKYTQSNNQFYIKQATYKLDMARRFSWYLSAMLRPGASHSTVFTGDQTLRLRRFLFRQTFLSRLNFHAEPRLLWLMNTSLARTQNEFRFSIGPLAWPRCALWPEPFSGPSIEDFTGPIGISDA